ncbi:G patch domain-containing protein 1 isoform X2 [Callorhinchus milii]|uniref:G patch domain-containing protein 1 isoform X2 n=1 Tax=Callorhinchus milii TaxID=7868 RepID=UPI001C3FF521|nr:G patch domain-containing protein 1 isoform X2 [Callorhinchus milii]
MAALDADSEEEAGEWPLCGTPLEPLPEDAVDRKKPLQEQTVRDERGRYQRFHGAFTGGFSAGYFNSVGSREGWTPATFVSSRQQKAETQQYRPEDFMDEEDLNEHGIAPTRISTRESFASKSTDKIRDKARALAAVTAPIPEATILDDLISPAKETLGVQLLRRMGWKEGQGLGPRVGRKRHQRQKLGAIVEIYGCALPATGSDGSQEEDDDQPNNVTFAPKDVIPVVFSVKDDRHGLGYSGLDPSLALYTAAPRGDPHLLDLGSERARSLLGDIHSSKGRKLGITGQGFGVGALEEEDEDVYGTDSLARYDHVLGEEEPGDRLYGWTAPRHDRAAMRGSAQSSAFLGKVVEGFSPTTQPAAPRQVYEAPELPRGYSPFHYFRPVVTSGLGSSALAQALQASSGQLSTEPTATGRHQLTAAHRQQCLGEAPLPGPSSVFDLLTEKDKERLKEAQQRGAQPGARAPLPVRPALTGPWHTPASSDSLHLEPGVTGQFKPFVKLPEKQRRYEMYLERLQAGRSDALDSCLDASQTEWERGREREEFVRSATLFQPVNTALASRFTHARVEDSVDTVEVPAEQEGDVDDKEVAVKMKLFGQLTRDTFEWHPHTVLCKRFNVPDPYPGAPLVGLLKVKRDKFSVFNFLTVPQNPPDPAVSASPTAPAPATAPAPNCIRSNPRRRSRWDVSAEEKEKEKDSISEFLTLARTGTPPGPHPNPRGESGVEPESTEPLPKEMDVERELEESRPSIDLFKAIFASSSDEKSSSSSSEDEEEEEEAVTEAAVATPHPCPDPTGKQQGCRPQEAESREVGSRPVAAPGGEQEAAEEEFGPKLPPAHLCAAGAALGSETQTPQPSASVQHKEKQKKKHKEKHRGRKDPKHKKKKKKHKKEHHRSRPREWEQLGGQ